MGQLPQHWPFEPQLTMGSRRLLSAPGTARGLNWENCGFLQDRVGVSRLEERAQPLGQAALQGLGAEGSLSHPV